MSEQLQLLLAHHLKSLKLPTFSREYDKVAQQCAAEGMDYPRYLLRLAELELIERERRMVERRIREAKFPAVKSLDSFDFRALPSINKPLVNELARCEYILRRENIIALGNSGTGKSHLAAALVGYVIRKLNRPARFMSVSALSRMILESKDFKKAKYTESQVIEAMASLELLVIDEIGVQSGSDAESRALFDVFNTRYEHMKPTIFISNLQLDGFAAAVGGRIMSRLREDGGEILSFNWEDCRK